MTVYGKDFMPEPMKTYEEAYDEIMKIICKHCKECTQACPIGHAVWKFVKGEYDNGETKILHTEKH